MATYSSTSHAIERVCEWVAAHPGASRGGVIHGLQLSESAATVYRWLEAGVSRGLIDRVGNTSASTYHPSAQMRKRVVQRHLDADMSKRGRVGYNADWLESYEPNVTTLLPASTLDLLTRRCPIGTVALDKVNPREISMFTYDLSYASSRLEGNEYDLASTIALAEHHIEKNGGSPSDKAMILNHLDATRFMVDALRDPDPKARARMRPTKFVVRSLHALLSHDLLRPEHCGTLRTAAKRIGYSAYAPLDVPDTIAAHMETISRKACAIENPFEQSFFLSVHLPYLQPFDDCNKRTARVACNLPLLAAGVTPISWMEATHRSRDYANALLAVYELNDTLMLQELFVDCLLRSSERFHLLRSQRAPDPVATKYRPEIKQVIRNMVLRGDEAIPASVSAEDVDAFWAYVTGEIDRLRLNEMLGVRYDISPAALRGWMEQGERRADRGVDRACAPSGG